MPPVVDLTAYELGQIMALLPDVAWSRMDNQLRKKLKDAQEKVLNPTPPTAHPTKAEG